jgi:hypothetical protein
MLGSRPDSAAMLLGRRQWPYQHIRATEEDEPWIFLAVVSGVSKAWRGWAARRLRQLHDSDYRRRVLFMETCYITAVQRFQALITTPVPDERLTALQRFQALIRMQIPDGRPPENYRCEITFRIHNFWIQFVYPRFIIEQVAFYTWRATTRAAKTTRDMQMYFLEMARTDRFLSP